MSNNWKTLMAKAEKLGTEHGTTAGENLVAEHDATFTEEQYDAYAIEWSGPLSGEWGDDLTPLDLLETLTGSRTDLDLDTVNDVCTAYEDGYWSAHYDVAVRPAQRVATAKGGPTYQ